MTKTGHEIGPKTLTGYIESFSSQEAGPLPTFIDESAPAMRFAYVLKDGDILTVFNDAARQKPLWGPTVLKFKHDHIHPDYFPEGISEHRWRSLIRQHKPATVIVDVANRANWNATLRTIEDLTP